eukprot:CAMPEP_0171265150 /NCGR_PEP_ID=MMETSP0790-20130122/57973_1 /TAXON_ID=2925 /ORGANISM="Alexandrium catenella, Strain OF101" /LENGTH=156 /DNA_ID=CAMNT_0011733803 /DNA_START=46 /DNA_END=513 /DNA_ORIENTATION=+
MSACQAMRRCRPVPLVSEEDQLAPDADGGVGGFDVIVKNTFLEVSDVADGATERAAPAVAAGLRTAPASLHRAGVMQHSLAAAAQTPRRKTDSREIAEADSASTQTPGSTPPTPSQVACLWPPTPHSPTAPVRLSLVDLTGFEPWGAPPASGSTSP